MKGKKKIALWVCSLTALACGVLAFSDISVQASAEFSVDGNALKSEYFVGDIYEPPPY